MNNEIDTNVNNYTLAELLTILSLDTPSLDRDSLTEACDKFILRFQKENNRSIAGGITDYTEINEKGVILVDNSRFF